METGQTMLVARPGLRLWIADNRGKVSPIRIHCYAS